MYSTIFKNFKSSFTFLIVIAVILTGYEMFFPEKNSGMYIVWFIVALYLHVSFMRDVSLMKLRAEGIKDVGYWLFLAISFLFLAVTVLLTLTIVLVIGVVFFGGFDQIKEALVLFLLPPTFLFSTVILTLFGTKLPAASIRDSHSFSDAYLYGQANFLRGFGALLLVQITPMLVLSIVGVGVLLLFDTSVLTEITRGSFVSFLTNINGVIGVQMTASVLCYRYKEFRVQNLVSE